MKNSTLSPNFLQSSLDGVNYILHNFTRVCTYILQFTSFYKSLRIFYIILQDFVLTFYILHHITYYQILPDITRYYQILPDFSQIV